MASRPLDGGNKVAYFRDPDGTPFPSPNPVPRTLLTGENHPRPKGHACLAATQSLVSVRRSTRPIGVDQMARRT
jgi:hypothetical protein